MPLADFIKNFNGAKKNFMEKHPPQNPRKNPYGYLERVTDQNVIFSPCTAHIFKRRYKYTVAARYYSRRDTKESYGNTDNFSATADNLYLFTTGGGYGIPDEVKKIYSVSTTFRFYTEVELWKAIEEDAKPKLAKNFINAGASTCTSSDITSVTITYKSQIGADETFRKMEWSYIYLKNKSGGKGECIGIAYLKEGKYLYRFYKKGKGKTKEEAQNQKKSKKTRTKSNFNFGRLVASLVVISLVGFFVLTTAAKGWKKFTVTASASGFSINRNSSWSYSIKELGIKQKSNSFYLEDYFVSEELGKEYTIRGAVFPIGKVKLAKKADHYNEEVYQFNLAHYQNKEISIKSNMNYVRIYSDSSSTYCTYIRIEKRSTPVDIIFENAHIESSPGVPVICSVGICDVNIIARGNNVLKAGKQKFSNEDLKRMIKDGFSNPFMRSYYDDLKYVYNEIQYWKSGTQNKSFASVYEHYGLQLTDSLLSFTEGVFDFVVEGVGGILAGRKGEAGGMGADAVLLLGGLSVKCEGQLSIIGGSGGNGLNANNSLMGSADGGNGGNGGDGVCCTSFLAAEKYDDTTLSITGGSGGSGGEPSKGGFGIFGSSGRRGRTGNSGKAISLPKKK